MSPFLLIMTFFLYLSSVKKIYKNLQSFCILKNEFLQKIIIKILFFDKENKKMILKCSIFIKLCKICS